MATERHANEHVRKLSELSFPPPSALQVHEAAQLNSESLRRVNSDLSKLELEEPSALSEADRRRLEEGMASRISEAISSLQLPDPELVGRAARRADGTVTPGPV